MKNSAKAIVVKIMVTVLIISMASAFSACKKKSKVPTKEEFLNEHINDPDPHGVKKLDFNREDRSSCCRHQPNGIGGQLSKMELYWRI